MDSDPSHLFSVDLPLDVPITLEQIQGPCSQDMMERCVFLYITSKQANQLSQGSFHAFLAGNQTTILFGKSTPSPNCAILYVMSSGMQLVYVITPMSSISIKIMLSC